MSTSKMKGGMTLEEYSQVLEANFRESEEKSSFKTNPPVGSEVILPPEEEAVNITCRAQPAMGCAGRRAWKMPMQTLREASTNIGGEPAIVGNAANYICCSCKRAFRIVY